MSWLGSASGVRLQSSTPGTPQTGNINLTGTALFGNGATSAGFISFYEDSDNGTNTCKLIGPASCADITVTLPASTGTLALTSDVIPLANITDSATAGLPLVSGGGSADPAWGAASNVDLKLFSSGTGGTIWGTLTTVGSLTGCTSNGTTTIAKASHGLTLLAGDTVRVTGATTAADVGFYRLVSSTAGTLVVSRALAGSDADVALTVYRTGMALGSNGRLYNTSTLTGSTGTMFGISFSPQVNQSGTAGYTGIYLDALETATGSGTKRLLDLCAGGVTMFAVGNSGAVVGVDSTWNKPNITTTLTAAVSLANVTPATVGVTVQQSPALRFEGHAWETTGGTDDKFEWYNFVLPATGATATSTLYWQHSKEGAAVTSPMYLSSAGALTLAGSASAANFDSGNRLSGTRVLPATTTSPVILNDNANSTADRGPVSIGGGAYTQTSGTNWGAKIAMTYNQATGTAANTDLLIQRTETAVGSGAQNFIDAQVGGVSKFSVSNQGNIAARNYTVQLTADAAIQFGNVVMPDAGTDGRFDINTGSATSAIGVLAGIGASAAGTAYNIVVDGLAYVTPTTGTAITRGHYLVMSSTAGYVDDSAALGAAGLTIGKALYSEAMYTAASADVNLTNDTFKLSSAPGWAVGEPVIYYNGGGASATGLTSGNTYWVQSITTDTITVAATKGGSKIDISGTGNNAQYFLRLPQAIINIQ